MGALLRAFFFVCLVKPFLTLFLGLRVRGRGNLPAARPFILIANHSSHLDTVALMSLFPIRELDRIRPVAAADYFERNRLVSFLSHTFFNVLCIERRHVENRPNPLEILTRSVSQGESLIFFPEGTRSVSGELGPFHSGIAHLAQNFPEVPMIPVYLSGMGRALPKGEFLMVPFFCEVRIGKAVFPLGGKDEILESLRQAVLNLKRNLS